MPAPRRCLHGHRWEVSEEASTTDESRCCPVCLEDECRLDPASHPLVGHRGIHRISYRHSLATEVVPTLAMGYPTEGANWKSTSEGELEVRPGKKRVEVALSPGPLGLELGEVATSIALPDR